MPSEKKGTPSTAQVAWKNYPPLIRFEPSEEDYRGLQSIWVMTKNGALFAECVARDNPAVPSNWIVADWVLDYCVGDQEADLQRHLAAAWHATHCLSHWAHMIESKAI